MKSFENYKNDENGGSMPESENQKKLSLEEMRDILDGNLFDEGDEDDFYEKNWITKFPNIEEELGTYRDKKNALIRHYMKLYKDDPMLPIMKFIDPIKMKYKNFNNCIMLHLISESTPGFGPEMYLDFPEEYSIRRFIDRESKKYKLK